MKRFTAFCLLIVLSALAGAALAAPKAGDVIADTPVKAAPRAEEAQYLGLAGARPGWKLSQIKAEVLLVEIFSMYCPRCQAEAPAVNRLYEKLKASPQGERLKFVAIGAGNSQFEVDFFRKKYQAAMPMIQDADYALHKTFLSVGTPSYFVLKPQGGGFKVLLFHEGQFGDENAFLEQVLGAAGMR